MLALTLGLTPVAISDGPGEYTRNMNCSWNITAQEEHMRIRIDFTSFNTSEFADHVTVYDGGHVTAHPKRHFGTSRPAPITSSGPNMLVVFRSDNGHAAEGFEATLSAVVGPTPSPHLAPMAPLTGTPIRPPSSPPSLRPPPAAGGKPVGR